MTEVEKLPARIDGLALQVQQLRTEMRSEFSAVRGDLAKVESRLDAKVGTLDAKVDTLGSRLDAKIDSKFDGLGVQMRVLHEEVISRIALIQEVKASSPRKPRKP